MPALPRSSTARGILVGLALLVSSAGRATGAGRVEGRVVDPDGLALPGVTVSLAPAGEEPVSVAVTGIDGRFVFEAVAPGEYEIVASLAGFDEGRQRVRVAGDGAVEVAIRLELAAFAETVTVEEKAPLVEVEAPSGQAEVAAVELEALPLENDRFVDALPLIPGVVRGPDGLLNFDGARASQSSLLVNGSNVTDPLTGEFATELPLDAVDTVEVHTSVYSAEFGKVTAGVTNVVTRAGDDEWKVQFNNFIPRLNWRDGDVRGIRTATPRLRVSGPLDKGKAWISQALTYRFVRSPVEEPPYEEEILNSFDSLTQLDVQLSPRHALTATLSVFPSSLDNLGVDTLHPIPATPDFTQRGWNAAVAEKAILGEKTVLETSFALKEFDVRIEPKTDDAAALTPLGLRRNYFNRQERDSFRTELNAALSHQVDERAGSHLVKIGANFSDTRFDGLDRSGPVEIRDADDRLLRRIEFRGEGRLAARNKEIAAYVQDHWRPHPRLTLDLGLRYDHERLAREHHLSPRVGFAVSLSEEAKTVVKGGFGVFYDKIFLHAAEFTDFQRRVEIETDGAGAPRSIEFANRLAPEGLRVPRSIAWNLEWDRLLTKTVMLRVNVRERRGSRELVVDRLEDAPAGPSLLLAARGRSRARALEVTVRKEMPRGGELFFSYVRARTEGDLNNFGALYGNRRDPLLFDNERSLQPFDVPHRFLAWGIVKLPKDIIVAPAIEWRSGFPYTVLDEAQRPVGPRNRGGRFPVFLSADLKVMKDLTVLDKYRVRVGVQLFNFPNYFNPRDVQNNVASPLFGEFANSVPISIRGKLQLLF